MLQFLQIQPLIIPKDPTRPCCPLFFLNGLAFIESLVVIIRLGLHWWLCLVRAQPSQKCYVQSFYHQTTNNFLMVWPGVQGPISNQLQHSVYLFPFHTIVFMRGNRGPWLLL